MVVCSFFQQGRCRYGDRCRNEHPGQVTSGSSANRFSVLGANQPAAANTASAQQQQDKNANFHVTAEGIQLDLTPGKDLPSWLFSAYGPGKNAPRQLFGGPTRELSFEEMRLRHYEATAAGNMNQAVQEAQKLHQETTNQIQIILSDLNGAVKYILDGQNEHPNRIDIVAGRTSAQPAFGQQQPTPSSTPAFGQPSSFGAASTQGTTTPAPAFGQPSLPGQNQPAFGRPSGLGASTAGPAFGKPAMLGGAQPAFGRPGFGQPSGQPAFGKTGFGQPSAIGGTGFASNAAGPSAFSQATQPNPLAQGAPTGFGQPSTVSPFGQAAGQQTASPFAQIGNQPAPSTGFGQPSQTPSLASQPQSLATNPFSQAQTAVSATPSVFGQPTAPAAPAFGTAQQPKPTNVARASLGPKPGIRVDMGELDPIPALTGDTFQDPVSRKLIRWKGRPVEYKDNHPRYLHPADNKTWVRIFFPDGPPEAATLRDCSDKEENYTPEVTSQYQYFVENGVFKDNIIPSVPPKTEWVSFDF